LPVADEADLEAMLADVIFDVPSAFATSSDSAFPTYGQLSFSPMGSLRAATVHVPALPRPLGLSSLAALSGAGGLRSVAVALINAVAVPQESGRPLVSSFLERFQILRLLGEGNFGTVYEARDLRGRQSRHCALKILHRRQYRTHSMLRRARQERHVLKAARHPFVVGLWCSFRTSSGELALVMEYCPGGNLNELVVRCGRPGLQEVMARRILAEVLMALEYLHDELDVIFRDLKPDNVVFDGANHAKLSDFGLAKVDASADEGATSFVGTDKYLAPEISVDGMDPYGKAVDLYALGLVAWICFTGGNRVPIDDARRNDGSGGSYVAGPLLRAEPPASHETLVRWLDSAGANGADASSSSMPFTGPSNDAVGLVKVLTAREPAARGTARALRRHSFFTRSGFEPRLASDADWRELLPPPHGDDDCGLPTPTPTLAGDSWLWDPP